MSGRPDLAGIRRQMAKGKDFQLTRDQYIRSTGIDIPQNKSYTENDSAVAKAAKENGYELEVVEERLLFKKKGRLM